MSTAVVVVVFAPQFTLLYKSRTLRFKEIKII